MKQKKIYFQ